MGGGALGGGAPCATSCWRNRRRHNLARRLPRDPGDWLLKAIPFASSCRCRTLPASRGSCMAKPQNWRSVDLWRLPSPAPWAAPPGTWGGSGRADGRLRRLGGSAEFLGASADWASGALPESLKLTQEGAFWSKIARHKPSHWPRRSITLPVRKRGDRKRYGPTSPIVIPAAAAMSASVHLRTTRLRCDIDGNANVSCAAEEYPHCCGQGGPRAPNERRRLMRSAIRRKPSAMKKLKRYTRKARTAPIALPGSGTQAHVEFGSLIAAWWATAGSSRC